VYYLSVLFRTYLHCFRLVIFLFYGSVYCLPMLFRTCLRYFLPPQWVMDKDAVSVLGIQELAAFPLDDFFDHYEKGLRKVTLCIDNTRQLCFE